MNKFFVVALASLFVCSAVDAQILRADELESYAKEKYGEKWVEAATNLGTQLTLDKNNAITYTQVIPAEVAKTEHSHPLGMVVSTHFRCGKWVKRGLKNGALPFNID